MKEVSIKELAYLIKQAKENNQPQPIFFLGAGASVTGNIPPAQKITEDILTNFSDSPFIKRLEPEHRTYSKLMECLQPHQRNTLLKQYILEAKINVTHIYLAQLMVHGYVDYVLTVNFDNLMLRALALFNEFPPTYDMAILKDFTTTTFKTGSVVYLHGQHHGLWLLNTPDEMSRVHSTLTRIFDSIKNERPWIFIGYSASDPVFEHIKELGRFDNGFYWVGYGDEKPAPNVVDFLSQTHKNAFLIKGHDADAFMLKLNEELGLMQPKILDKPFSALRTMLNEVNDIDDQEHFKGVRERVEISKKNVDTAIRQFEENENIKIDKREQQIDRLKKEIIKNMISETYDEEQILDYEKEAKALSDNEINKLLSGLYFNWGVILNELAKKKSGKAAEELFSLAIEKYQKSTNYNPVYHQAYYNWGDCLVQLSKTKPPNEAKKLLQEALEKTKATVDLGGDSYNYACVLALNGDKENALKYLDQSLSKNEITYLLVISDDDWKDYSQDNEFLAIVSKYKPKRVSFPNFTKKLDPNGE
jgi:tetratricopeptide (TPR) repeat protein